LEQSACFPLSGFFHLSKIIQAGGGCHCYLCFAGTSFIFALLPYLTGSDSSKVPEFLAHG
jgi:hypothetical protein